MPTPDYFSRHAPFPDDLPVAELLRISLKKIAENDEAACHALFEASLDNGFFLLDFKDSPDSEVVMKEMEQCFEAHHEFFALEDAEKNPYAFVPGKSTLGYKPAGSIKDDKGRVDRAEMMTYGSQQILATSESQKVALPMQPHVNLLQSTAAHLHSTAVTLLTALEQPLQLPRGTFASLSNPTGPTQSQLRFLHMAPAPARKDPSEEHEPSLGGHTDNGSLTILFNVIGGLQIVPPGRDPEDEASWLWVRPEPGCAVVNFGDSMVKWSGELIRSNIHRVVDPPGLQATEHRYSGGYFLKPAEDALMRSLVESPLIQAVVRRDGEDTNVMKCLEWSMKRNKMLKDGSYKVQSQGGRPLPELSNRTGQDPPLNRGSAIAV